MEDPLTRMSQNFFSFPLSHSREVMWLPPHKLFPSLFSLPSPLHWCVYAALSFLSFPITHRSFPIYPHLCLAHIFHLVPCGTLCDNYFGHKCLGKSRTPVALFNWIYIGVCSEQTFKKSVWIMCPVKKPWMITFWISFCGTSTWLLLSFKIN